MKYVLIAMIAWDLSIHITMLTMPKPRIDRWARKHPFLPIPYFYTQKSYNQFWATYWGVALLISIRILL